MSASFYSTVLFVHVLAAVLLVGSSIQSLFVRRSIQAARSVPDLASWLAFAHRTTRLNPLFAVVLLASGIYLGSAGWWSSAWFYVSIAAWVMNSALAGGVVKRGHGLLMEAAGRAGAGEVSAQLDRMRRSGALAGAEDAMLANDVVILYVMMSKPELLECIVLLAATHAIAAVIGAMLRSRRETAPKETPSIA